MAHLASLKFTNLPPKIANNPALIRRKRLVDRLEEQKRLVADPTLIPVTKRWKKNPDGSRSIVDHYRRIRPWWRIETDGNVLLTVKSGLKVLEFEKGKSAISVGGIDRLGSVLETLVAATRAGELDRVMDNNPKLTKTVMQRPKIIA